MVFLRNLKHLIGKTFGIRKILECRIILSITVLSNFNKVVGCWYLNF